MLARYFFFPGEEKMMEKKKLGTNLDVQCLDVQIRDQFFFMDVQCLLVVFGVCFFGMNNYKCKRMHFSVLGWLTL